MEKREAIEVAERLKAVGARINYYDSFVPANQNGKDTFQGLSELTSDALASYDLLVITTAHTKIDYQFVQQNARFIFDTRNATAAVANKENIELL